MQVCTENVRRDKEKEKQKTQKQNNREIKN